MRFGRHFFEKYLHFLCCRDIEYKLIRCRRSATAHGQNVMLLSSILCARFFQVLFDLFVLLWIFSLKPWSTLWPSRKINKILINYPLHLVRGCFQTCYSMYSKILFYFIQQLLCPPAVQCLTRYCRVSSIRIRTSDWCAGISDLSLKWNCDFSFTF